MKRKKKNNDQNITYFDEYKNYKNSMKNICTDHETLDIINDLCIRTNTIIRHATCFLKLYFNHLFENNIEIDVNLLRYIYTFVSTIDLNRKPKTNMIRMIDFNNNIFSKLNMCQVSRDGLTNILSYESEILVTNIETNIKVHFYQHFAKYINVLFKYSETEETINKKKISDEEKKKEIKKVRKELYDIKTVILSNKKVTNTKHKKEILKIRKELFSHVTDINEKGIAYDVHVQPQKYLKSLYIMIEHYELLNEENKNKPNFKEIKLFNVLPMRTTLIPRNITIDTEIIIQNFKEKLKERIHEIDKTCKNIEDLRINFCNKNLHNKIWSVLFNMKDKFFKNKNKYKFNFSLKTNGISYSAQFKLKDELYKHKKPKIKALQSVEEFKYIDNIDKKNRFDILNKKKNVVCIDPNKRDLMYCGTYKNNEFVNFRYTQLQRQNETQSKNHRKIRQELEKIKVKKKKINGKNVRWNKKDEKALKEYELEKCKYSMKIINTKKMKENINRNEKINNQIRKNYEEKIYRKLEWNGFINREKSESKMIKNFEEKMGKKEDTIVIVGDYSMKAKHMNGTIPAISKRILTIFKKHKYEVYVTDEYRTSKTCNECGEET